MNEVKNQCCNKCQGVGVGNNTFIPWCQNEMCSCHWDKAGDLLK